MTQIICQPTPTNEILFCFHRNDGNISIPRKPTGNIRAVFQIKDLVREKEMKNVDDPMVPNDWIV